MVGSLHHGHSILIEGPRITTIARSIVWT